MIGSIREALQAATLTPAEGGHGDAGAPPAGGVTRADFLRTMAAGALAAGLSTATCAAASTPARRIAPVTDIEKLYDAWQERLNTGDIDGLVDLYMEDVTYVSPEGRLLYGRNAVREDFVGLFAIKPRIVLGNRKHLLYKDIVLTTNHWRMNFTNADGVMQEVTGGGIEVMRKDPRDGGWRYIIDDASRSAH